MAINKENQKSVATILDINVYKQLVEVAKFNKRSISAQIAYYVELALVEEADNPTYSSER